MKKQEKIVHPPPDYTITMMLYFNEWFWDTCSDEQAAIVLDRALQHHLWDNTAVNLLR